MPENESQKRKCIGVFIAKPDREYQSELLRGIYKAAFEQDMNVAVFGATLAGGVASARESELDIYTLPNYDKLSGIIYVPDAFDYKRTDEMITKPLVQAVKDKKLCAVSIDCELEGIPAVICDDSEAIRLIVEHTINVHGCRDIAFMTGSKDNPFAENRLELFRQVMKEHDLEILPDRTYYGDFWYNEGENFVKLLTESKDGMPDAIICANGPMACSVYKALRKTGYVIPRDVIVACYTDEVEPFKYITSSSKQVDFAGYAVCRKLIEQIGGSDDSKYSLDASLKRDGDSNRFILKCECKVNESITCGCLPAENYDHSIMEGIDINAPQSYFSEFNFMTTDLLNRPGYREMFWALDWYTIYIPNIRGIYFCLCDDWASTCKEEDMQQYDNSENNDDAAETELRVGYTKQIQPYYYRINKDDGTHESVFECSDLFPREDMFPKLFDASGEPSSYIFRSLHFADRNFGYIVIDNGSRMQTYDISFDYWLRDVANTMEYHRKLNNEKYLYSSDFMTGLINRNGFNRMMPSMINEAHRGNFQLLFAVCDLNGLKYINDTFGHVEGDNSIKVAANALAASDFPHLTMEKNFRIGGDEFVKAVIGHFTDEQVEAFRNKAYQILSEYNKTSGKPYPVYLSIGAVVKDPEEEYTPDSLILEADKLMFAEKQRLKEVTGFDHRREI